MIAYVVKMFPRLSETFILNELLELERRGEPLVVFSLKTPPPGPRHAMLGRLRAEVVHLPQSPWRALPVLARAHGGLLRRDPARWLRTLAGLRSGHPWSAFKRFLQAGVLVHEAERRGVRHLHAHFATSATRVAMLAARLSDLGYSFTAHAKDIYLDGQDVGLLRAKLGEARFVVTVSDYNRRHLERTCGAAAAAGVVRIYNGVDLAALAAPAAERARDVVLTVARLVEKKGLDDLLEAVARLTRRGVDCRLRIAGDGPLRGALERRARELQLDGRVTFLGALPHEQVARELAAATVFALPCVVAADGNRDGLPTVILEAMALRLPVVSTAVTGIPEMIEHEVSGLVVPERRPDALADALARVLGDPALASRMGAAGRARVEQHFSLRTNVGELHRRLAGALAAQRAAAPAPGGVGAPQRRPAGA